MRFTIMAALMFAAFVTPASAQITMCDTAYENCRIPIIERMDREQVGIDVFVWFAEDQRYIAAMRRALLRGVLVRVIANDRWSSGHRKAFMDSLKLYAIPTRVTCSTPSHIKAMMFRGQRELMFTGGNFTSSMVPEIPFANYIDEVVMFNSTPSIFQSFVRIFEDEWTNTTLVRDYCGTINPLRTSADIAPVDPSIHLGWGSMTAPLKRAAALIDAEHVGIDVVMYRLQDSYTRAALIRALRRGVPVRILSDSDQYRNYAGMKAYVDAVIAAGAQFKWRVHAGMTHEKFAIFYGQGIALVPSNNWDSWSAVSAAIQTTDAATFAWGVQHFARKWNSPTEFN